MLPRNRHTYRQASKVVDGDRNGPLELILLSVVVIVALTALRMPTDRMINLPFRQHEHLLLTGKQLLDTEPPRKPSLRYINGQA